MKKNVAYLSHQTKFLCGLGFLALVAIACIPQIKSKSKLTYYYNGATIRLPPEIDCAALGDTLYVTSAKTLGKNSREIQIGYRQDSATVNNRFQLKN